MSNQNPENFSDGEWDEKGDLGDLAWNEHDWQQYLNRNEKEITRFISLYKKLKGKTGVLDDIAIHMGWERDEWTVLLELPFDGSEERSWEKNEDLFAEEDAEPEIESMDPYTLHRYPVYIATRGLYRSLFEEWEEMIQKDGVSISLLLAYKIPQSFRDGEHNALMGIFAVDTGDYNLCVSHLKNALSFINKSLHLLQQIPVDDTKAEYRYVLNAQTMLFDLRELWLRVMTECREEFKRGFRG